MIEIRGREQMGTGKTLPNTVEKSCKTKPEQEEKVKRKTNEW
jgi:hypothetical protein